MPRSPQGRRGPRSKKVFIVEDHPLFRQGLVQLLAAEKDLKVCGEAETAAEALKSIARLKPDLVLVDLTLPGRSGLDLIKDVRAANRKVKLLVVSMHDEEIYADRVLRAGGDGYIMKQEDPEEILNAARDVLQGRVYLSEQILARNNPAPSDAAEPEPARPLDQLTDTELQILELLGRGKNHHTIAQQLRMDRADVSSHSTRIRQKLRLKTDKELLHRAAAWVDTGAM